MRLTKPLITLFEADQARYGTKVALHNLLWLQAAALFKDLGITRVRTSRRKATK